MVKKALDRHARPSKDRFPAQPLWVCLDTFRKAACRRLGLGIRLECHEITLSHGTPIWQDLGLRLRLGDPPRSGIPVLSSMAMREGPGVRSKKVVVNVRRSLRRIGQARHLSVASNVATRGR